MLTINEIFHSIQGESTHAGRPCVFVRLTACDLRCSWCDTPYAFHEGRKMSVDEVVGASRAYRLRRRRDHRRRAAAAEGRLSADAAAARRRAHRDARDRRPPAASTRFPTTVIRDRSTSSARAAASPPGTTGRTSTASGRTDEVKFVIKDRERLRVRARRRAQRHALPDRCAAVLFSPVHGVLRREAARGVDSGGSSDRPAAAPGAQVHLGCADARGLSWPNERSSC